VEKNTSEFVKALAAAQAEMGNALLNKVNPHFKSKYADFAAVREATLPILNKHGFALIQMPMIQQDGSVILRTELAHLSGESRLGHYPIPQGTPQQQGSALTYARRYCWSAICGIASEEDDDGNAASTGTGKVKSAHKSRKDGDWEALTAGIQEQTSESDLKSWAIANQGKVSELPDSWRTFLREAYEAKLIELREGVTEQGDSELKKQLKASLAE
jgi:hypothetical protein